jgi:hypothetical protein
MSISCDTATQGKLPVTRPGDEQHATPLVLASQAV